MECFEQMPAFLEVDDLVVEYRRQGRVTRAVDGVSFRLDAGGSLGIVGESGSGKSSLARAIVGLQPAAAGVVRFEGADVASYGRGEWQDYRRAVQLVFQDVSGSLNPRMRVGDTVGEVLSVHAREEYPRGQLRRKRVIELLELVELTTDLADRFPHELSGGQRQRVALARALAVKPRLLIADEPVSALDVSVQAQIIHLLERLRCELNVAILLIAHDLALVRLLCPEAVVMHRGKVVERGRTEEIFTRPEADYTRDLLAAVPDISRALKPEIPA